jgi:hypothetical protein
MASDGQPVQIPAVSLVHGSQAPTTIKVPQSGNPLPPSGNAATSAAAAKAVTAAKAAQPPQRHPAPVRSADAQAQVTILNKYLNDSGKPAQFRVDPTSGNKLIQEVNPANGQVIAEYSATEFAALARSVGISGAIVDDHA